MFEEGVGTKSYVDKEGNLFVLADNTELIYLLKCSEPTLIKIKELASYGLLEEEPVKATKQIVFMFVILLLFLLVGHT